MDSAQKWKWEKMYRDWNICGKHSSLSSLSSICHHSLLCQGIHSPTPQQLSLWIRLCPARSTAVGPLQKVARACNPIGTWQGLLIPPGKRLMCSQTFWGFLCHLGQQRLWSAPRNSWQGQSPDPKLRDAPVSRSSWVWSVSAPGTGLSACVCVREAREREKTKQNKPPKSALQHRSIGLI